MLRSGMGRALREVVSMEHYVAAVKSRATCTLPSCASPRTIVYLGLFLGRQKETVGQHTAEGNRSPGVPAKTGSAVAARSVSVLSL